MSDIQARVQQLGQDVAALDRELSALDARIDALALQVQENPELAMVAYRAARAEMNRLKKLSAACRSRFEELRIEAGAAERNATINLDGLPRAIAAYLDDKLNKKR